MRKVRFRGICDGQCSRKGEMVYGMFRACNIGNKEGGYEKVYLIDCDESGEKTHACYTIVPETLGQYTGLKDRNGTEIYEGDILQYADGRVGDVQWKDFLAGFYTNDFRIIEREMEIIGNIYENSNLIKN